MYEAIAAGATLVAPLADAGFQLAGLNGLTVIVRAGVQVLKEADAGLFGSGDEDETTAGVTPNMLAVEVDGTADARYMVV